MTDRGKEPVSDEARSLDTLWANQANIERQLEALSASVQRLTMEMRREFNLSRAGVAPHPPHREPTPGVIPGGRRGLGPERQWQRNHIPILEESNSEDDLQRQRDENLSDSEGYNAEQQEKALKKQKVGRRESRSGILTAIIAWTHRRRARALRPMTVVFGRLRTEKRSHEW
ncbi:hypothetical protein M5K25_025287 [Dendrobium thyrsiflorum]|uniref:Uncharacterized protein n=1 Tax=Dendrobium thyrsiflorum TaxID=117978 RepID=A0ABD0U3W7_DENTH